MANVREEMKEEILSGKIDMQKKEKQYFSMTGTEKTNRKRNKAKTPTGKEVQCPKAKKKTQKQDQTTETAKKIGARGKGAEDERKERIDWPNAKSAEWGRLDKDLTHMLRIKFSPAERRSEVLP